MRFLFLAAILLTACLESDDPKKVELVDNTTKNDPDAGKQAVSDEDFAALQAEVKALKNELASLKSTKADKSTVTGLVVDVAAHESELNSVANGLNSLASSTPKQLWLYDGNGSRKHKTLTVMDKEGYQEALVEVTSGITARYRINVKANWYSQQGPQPLESYGGTPLSMYFSLGGCSGEAISTDLGGDYGQAGSVGNYMVWISETAVEYPSFSVGSLYNNAGTCTGSSATTGKARVATLNPLSSFTYPNPLTVGP